MGRAIVNKDNVVRYASEVFDLFNQGFITSEMVTKLIKAYVEENTTYEDQPVVTPYKVKSTLIDTTNENLDYWKDFWIEKSKEEMQIPFWTMGVDVYQYDPLTKTLKHYK